MAWVLADAPQDLKPAEMLVAISLANHASSDGGHAYPSVQVVMGETRLSRRSVQSSLRSLEERGVILVEREATRRLPAMYAFCAFRGANPATKEWGEAQRVPPEAQTLHTGAQILPVRGAEIAPKPSVVTASEPTGEPSDTPLPPKPFDLWEAFCRANDRDYKTATSKAQDMALREAKTLVADGITVDDVVRCVAFMQSQRWRSGLMTFGHMVTAIGDWRMAGKPAIDATRSGANGRASPRGGLSVDEVLEYGESKHRAAEGNPSPASTYEAKWRTS